MLFALLLLLADAVEDVSKSMFLVVLGRGLSLESTARELINRHAVSHAATDVKAGIKFVLEFDTVGELRKPKHLNCH